MAAFTDYSSGLKTNCFLQEVLKPRYAHTGVLGCLFMRIENYAAIVQRFGHVRAEAAAIQAGQRLQEVLKDSAEVIRYGTNMYATLIPCNGELKTWGEVCKWYVEQSPVFICEKTVELALSVGMANRCTKETIDSLVERADNNLLETIEVNV